MSELSLSSTAIGIDIGTTYCYVGVCKNGTVEVIANEQGNRATPAVIGFTKERVVGEAAASRHHLNQANTVYHAKALLGYDNFDDAELQALLAASNFPFSVVAGPNNKPVVEVELQGAQVQLTAEELVATLLRQMKQTASQYMGAPMEKAVISIPTHFTEKHKAALLEAARLADLTVLALVDEPAAVAMAYELDEPVAASQTHSSSQTVVVVDCGGVSTHITVLAIQNGIMEILGGEDDTQLGGENIDSKLVEFFVKEFARQNDGMDLTQSARAMTRLRHACEKAKQVLSSTTSAAVELDALYEGVDLFSSISRSRFEGLINDFFKRIGGALERALQKAGVERDEVSAVIVCGGSGKIPRVNQTVKSYFGHKARMLSGQRGRSPDEAVAFGCALQASLLVSAKPDAAVSDVNEVQLSALSIGVEDAQGEMQVVIPRHTPLPTLKSVKVSVADLAAGGLLRVLEGELRSAKANHLLGSLALTGLGSAGSGEVTVEMSMDRDGNLEVHAARSGSEVSLAIPAGAKQLSEAEVAAALAAGHKEHEQLLAANVALAAQVEELEARAAEIRAAVNAGVSSGALTAADQKIMARAVDDVTSYLDSISQGPLIRAKKEEIERKAKGLELLFAGSAKKIEAHRSAEAAAAAAPSPSPSPSPQPSSSPAPPMMMDSGDLD